VLTTIYIHFSEYHQKVLPFKEFEYRLKEHKELELSNIRSQREQDLVDGLADPLRNAPHPPIPPFITRQSSLLKQATKTLSPLSNSSFLFWSARMRPELEAKRRMHLVRVELSGHALFYDPQLQQWAKKDHDLCT
jgi:hypothetical protein